MNHNKELLRGPWVEAFPVWILLRSSEPLIEPAELGTSLLKFDALVWPVGL